MTQVADQQSIAEAVARFFRFVDAGEWTNARACLTDRVDVAHGTHQETLSSEDAISGWKEAHARHEVTHYQLESLRVELPSQDHATVRCDSHVTLVPAEHANQTTQAIDGRYTIDLEREHTTWRIRSIRHDET